MAAAPNDYDDDYVEISKDSRRPSEQDDEDDDYVELVNPNNVVGQKNQGEEEEGEPRRNVWNEADRCTKGNYSVPKSMSCFVPADGQLSPEPQRKPKIDDTPTHMFDVEKFEKEHTQVPGGGVVSSSAVGKNRVMDVDGFEERKLKKRQSESIFELESVSLNRVPKTKEDVEPEWMKEPDWTYDTQKRSERLSNHVKKEEANMKTEDGVAFDVEIEFLDYRETYDLAVLQTQKMRLPSQIDRSELQRYLTGEQFEQAFKMSRDKFETLPKWKKTSLKKALHLF